jgi:hypothetical protein
LNTGGKAEVSTTGCNYKFHAVTPGEFNGKTDIKCANTAALPSSTVTEKSKLVKVSNSAGINPEELVTGTVACNAEKPTFAEDEKGEVKWLEKQAGGCIAGSPVTAPRPGPELKERTWVQNVVSPTEIELNRPAGGAGVATSSQTLTFTHDIQMRPESLTGCVIFFPGQNNLGVHEYKNEPAGEVSVALEQEKIQTGLASECAIFGKSGSLSDSREGKIGAKVTLCSAKPCPAKFQLKGKEPGGVTAIPLEVGLNEPHWYKNRVGLPPSEDGLRVMMWGAPTVTAAGVGTVTCETMWLANIYNPEGFSASARAGEARIRAYESAYCEAPVCESTLNSKAYIEPEGLGVTVNGTTAEARTWEAKLTAGSLTRVKIGNKTPGSPTAIKWHVVCPKTTGEEYNKSLTGELAPEFINGTSIGASPSLLEFNLGELEVGSEKAQVRGKLKLMGYEIGDLTTVKAP